MSKFVAIGTNGCSRSGGSATLLDLSRALRQAGASVVHVSDHGKWWTQVVARLSSRAGADCDASLRMVQWNSLYPGLNRHRFGTARIHPSPLKAALETMAAFVDTTERFILRSDVQRDDATVSIAIDPSRQKIVFPHAKPVANHAGSPGTLIEWWSSETQDSLGREAYRRAMRQYSHVLFQAQSHALEAIALGAATAETAIVLRPACDELAVSEAAQTPSPFRSQRRSVVYVGSLQERKDQATAIRAFASIAYGHGDVDLHLVGGRTASSQDYVAELRRLARSLKISRRVIFWGHRRDSSRFVSHATVVLQTSRSEGVSRTLREAAFLGKCIVATNLPGTVELLSREGAWLCDIGNHEEIGASIEAALTSSEARDRSNSAQIRYQTSWSWDNYVSNVAELAKRWNTLG